MTGRISVELKYDNIKLINYRPLLYIVQQNNKQGIMNENGEIIGNIEFDSMGIIDRNNKNNLLILKNTANIELGIIVCKDQKYGIINAKNGKFIVQCELDNISYEIENNNIVYYIEINNQKATLERYINYINTTVVNLQND